MNPNIQPNDQPATPEPNVTPEAPVVAPVVETQTEVTPQPVQPTPFTTPEAPVSPAFGTEPTPVTPATPVDPVAPVAPIGSGPAPVSAPVPNKSKKKLIILIGSIVGGVILLLIVGAIILALTTVSKAEYRQAVTQYNIVASSGSTLSSRISILSSSISSNDTDEEFNETVTEVEEAITDVKDENEKLSKMKAVRVGDGKEVYEAFDKKLDAYLAYGTDIVSSVKTVRPALLSCNGVSDAADAAARIAVLKSCSSSLGSVKDLPNEDFTTFVTGLSTEYASFVTTYEAISALTNPYGTQYEEYKVLRDKMYATQDNISTISKDFSAAITKHSDEVDVADSAKALGDVLEAKQK